MRLRKILRRGVRSGHLGRQWEAGGREPWPVGAWEGGERLEPWPWEPRREAGGRDPWRCGRGSLGGNREVTGGGEERGKTGSEGTDY